MSFGSRLDAYNRNVTRNKEMIDRVQNCVDHCAECNDWEDDFLGNILDWLMRGRELTAAQLEKLEQIEVIVTWGREAVDDGR